MPLRDTAITVQYFCLDAITGALTADDPDDHTYIFMRDGTTVTPADDGATTATTGINTLALTASENSGVMNLLIVTTTTSGITIPIIAWSNDLTADVARTIGIPLVAYNGMLNLYSGNEYGTYNPTITIPSTLIANISAATAYLKITSEENDGGTIYYSAADGVITGSSGNWSVAFDVPATGTNNLPLGVNSCFYHAYVSNGTAVATVGKGKVTVR